MAEHVPNIVVVGAGFAGLKLVQGLKKARANIAIFDRHNYHVFQPLLYQVASAALSPAEIAFPIRRIFRKQCNVQVVMAEVEKVDLERKTITAQGVDQDYDYLVLAPGSTHSYFGRDEWAKVAPGLKTVDDATQIRKRVLTSFEDAENELDENARRAKLTFVIVGGGPTGVELAGAMREIAVNDIQKDFRNIDTSTARVVLIEGNDRLIKQFHPKLSERAKVDLERMGVEIKLGARVTEIDENGLRIGEGERIDTPNIFWAAGVQAAPLSKTLGVELDKAGRVKVLPDLSVPGHPEVFIAGDMAAIKDEKTGHGVPGLAPAAMQMGQHIAKLLRTEIESGIKPPAQRKPFEYWDKGTMATIGKNKAVADIKGLRFGGFIAWVMWGLVHVMFLVSHRSRIAVMWSWGVNYLFNARPARLITGAQIGRVNKVRDVTPNETEGGPIANVGGCEMAAAPSSPIEAREAAPA